MANSLGGTPVAIVDYLINLTQALPTGYLPNAKFYMRKSMQTYLMKVRDNDDRPIFMYNFMTKSFEILGYPVVIEDYLPDMGVDKVIGSTTFTGTGKTPIIFGDLAQARYVSDGDVMESLIDPYSVDGGFQVKWEQEKFEMVGSNSAIIIAYCDVEPT